MIYMNANTQYEMNANKLFYAQSVFLNRLYSVHSSNQNLNILYS